MGGVILFSGIDMSVIFRCEIFPNEFGTLLDDNGRNGMRSGKASLSLDAKMFTLATIMDI